MKELEEYRANLLQRLTEAAQEFREACLAVQDPYSPFDKQGLSVHQIAVHTRDTDKLVYGLRARQTAAGENPEFQNFDGNVYLAEHYDPDEPLDEVLDGFVENIRALVELLQNLPDGAWSRASRHTTLGSGLTLQSWVEKNLAHIEEHLKAVSRRAGSK